MQGTDDKASPRQCATFSRNLAWKPAFTGILVLCAIEQGSPQAVDWYLSDPWPVRNQAKQGE